MEDRDGKGNERTPADPLCGVRPVRRARAGSADRHSGDQRQGCDGSERTSWIVWQNRRPYAPNVKVCELAERPTLWAQLDVALANAVMG
jgi:hypothetical protein